MIIQNPTKIKTIKTIGSNELLGKFDEKMAPKIDPIRPKKAMGNLFLISSGFFWKYVIDALAVPKTWAALFVPNNSAGEALGSPNKRAGKWINPPPPPIASTHPARNAASNKRRIISIEGI